MRYFSTPKAFTDVFESGQVPTEFESPVTLEWSISTGSNMSLALLNVAMQDTFLEELKRADNPDDQKYADAECRGKKFCGPCSLDSTSWKANVTNENIFSFSLQGYSTGYTDPYYQDIAKCTSSEYSYCPVNLVRFMLLRKSFMISLSEQLDTTVLLVSRPFYSYGNAFESARSPIVTGYVYSSCSSCENIAKVLWVSGEGAAILAEQFQGSNTKVVAF